MNSHEMVCRRSTRMCIAALVAIGLTDLITTIFWLNTGRAAEFNPIMCAVLQNGMVSFICFKLATLFGYSAMMEHYNSFNSVRARSFSIMALALYVAIYTVSIISVNHHLIIG